METANKLLRNQLKSLHEQAERNACLQVKFDHIIDPSLKGHFHIATFCDACLTVIANNGSTATRLRFIEADLITQLQNIPELKTLKKIKCKVRPSPPKETQKTVERHISSDNAQLIKQAAEHIKDERIKKALESLASRFPRSPE